MRITRDGKKRRTEAEWTELLSRLERSGLSLREFAEQEKVSVGSLQRWRGRLAASSGEQFVEVSPASAPHLDWHAEIQLPSGTILRLRG
jgi:hypothetical protein